MITGYTYFTEFYPEKYQSVIGTVWNVTEGMIVLLLVIYFVFITRNWRYIIWYAAITNIIFLIIALLYLPESPKWLF